MQAYVDGLNVDRMVAFCALVAFMKIQQSNRGYSKRVIMDEASKSLDKSKNLYKRTIQPFKHMGSSYSSSSKPSRNPFKNLK
jgi:hypothetical protein